MHGDRDQGGPGGPDDAPVETEHEQGGERRVDHDQQPREQHGRAGVAQPEHDRHTGRPEQQERDLEDPDLGVGLGYVENARGGTEKSEHGADQPGADQRQRQAEQRQGQKDAAPAPDACPVPRATGAGHEGRCSVQCSPEEQRHGEQHNRGQPDRAHLQHPQAAHVERVGEPDRRVG